MCEQEPLSPSAKLKTLNNEELTKTASEAPGRSTSAGVSTARGLGLDRAEVPGKGPNPPLCDCQRPGDGHRALLAGGTRSRASTQPVVSTAKAACAETEWCSCSEPPPLAALLLGTIISTCLWIKQREARREAEAARLKERQLRREAESREKATRAALLASQENYEEADRLMGETPPERPSVEAESVLRRLGEWHVVNGRWQEAADRFRALDKVNRLNNLDGTTMDYLRFGPALIESGDLSGYERFRHDILARFANTDTLFASRIVKASLLLPAPQELHAGPPIAGSGCGKKCRGDGSKRPRRGRV